MKTLIERLERLVESSLEQQVLSKAGLDLDQEDIQFVETEDGTQAILLSYPKAFGKHIRKALKDLGHSFKVEKMTKSQFKGMFNVDPIDTFSGQLSVYILD